MGLKPAEFWQLTPREYERYVEGRERAEIAGWQRSAWEAWHAAMFARAKRLSPWVLRRLIRRLENKPVEPLTPEQFYAKLRLWHLALGGSLEGKEN